MTKVQQDDRSSPINDEEIEDDQHDDAANVTQNYLSFVDSSSDTELVPNNVALKSDYHVSRNKKRLKKHKGRFTMHEIFRINALLGSQATVQCLSVGTQSALICKDVGIQCVLLNDDIELNVSDTAVDLSSSDDGDKLVLCVSLCCYYVLSDSHVLSQMMTTHTVTLSM